MRRNSGIKRYDGLSKLAAHAKKHRSKHSRAHVPHPRNIYLVPPELRAKGAEVEVKVQQHAIKTLMTSIIKALLERT